MTLMRRFASFRSRPGTLPLLAPSSSLRESFRWVLRRSYRTTLHADSIRASQNLATSDHHPFVAAASADGACTLANPARTSKKKAYKVCRLCSLLRDMLTDLLEHLRVTTTFACSASTLTASSASIAWSTIYTSR